MIDRLVQSALQTGWLSVESEALLRQMIATPGCHSNSTSALSTLISAIEAGQVQRECRHLPDLQELLEA
ncbi:MAG: hypothetical protein HC881_01535 [Leptolyngbyaceae cyanobacterium SL_7_1]|nr:hypothetical protein [Leptolyngbyaceae cyanobacterium SL_7_1]